MLKGLRGESNGDKDDNMCEWIDVHDIEVITSLKSLRLRKLLD